MIFGRYYSTKFLNLARRWGQKNRLYSIQILLSYRKKTSLPKKLCTLASPIILPLMNWLGFVVALKFDQLLPTLPQRTLPASLCEPAQISIAHSPLVGSLVSPPVQYSCPKRSQSLPKTAFVSFSAPRLHLQDNFEGIMLDNGASGTPSGLPAYLRYCNFVGIEPSVRPSNRRFVGLGMGLWSRWEPQLYACR